jgi:hypothetical protein
LPFRAGDELADLAQVSAVHDRAQALASIAFEAVDTPALELSLGFLERCGQRSHGEAPLTKASCDSVEIPRRGQADVARLRHHVCHRLDLALGGRDSHEALDVVRGRSLVRIEAADVVLGEPLKRTVNCGVRLGLDVGDPSKAQAPTG